MLWCFWDIKSGERGYMSNETVKGRTRGGGCLPNLNLQAGEDQGLFSARGVGGGGVTLLSEGFW